jgi:hypothetical protein
MRLEWPQRERCKAAIGFPMNRDLWPFATIIQRGKDIVYINATSTRECTFALSFAREYA